MIEDGFFVRNRQGKFQNPVFHLFQIVRPFQPVAVDTGERIKVRAHRAPFAIGAVRSAQDDGNIRIFLAEIQNEMDGFLRHVGGKNQFCPVLHIGPVFRHIGERILTAGKKIPQLIILISAGYDETAPGLLHARQDAPEAGIIIAVVGMDEGAVDVHGHQFDIVLHVCIPFPLEGEGPDSRQSGPLM